MKNIVLIISLLFLFNHSQAQKPSDKNAANIVKYIERNLDVNDFVGDSTGCDFFIYDISVDKKGFIESIHTIIMDSIKSSAKVFNIANNIKSTFHFSLTNYKKVYIPVVIVYEGEKGVLQKNSKSVLETFNLFMLLSKVKKEGVLISKAASVHILHME